MDSLSTAIEIDKLTTELAELRNQFQAVLGERDLFALQLNTLIQDPRKRKAGGEHDDALKRLSSGGERKTMRDIVETYIMPHVKFVRDAGLFNLSKGSIGWRILKVMKIHPDNQQGQVIWWAQRTKMIKDLMREHRSTGNRKIKLAVLKGEKMDLFKAMDNMPNI